MIPGDIDLTEKLDFRKVVNRDIPRLPEKWNKNDGVFNKVSSITYTTTNINNGQISVINGTNSNLHYNISISDINTNIYTTSSSNSIDVRLDSSNITYYFTYNSDSTKYIDIKYDIVEDEYDVFGNRKPKLISIPKIPWDKTYSYNSLSNIPWENINKYFFNNEPDIPWSDEEETIDNNYILSDANSNINKAKRFISWLSGKTLSFIRNYLNDEEDNTDLSYLTNMSWINVRDAII